MWKRTPARYVHAAVGLLTLRIRAQNKRHRQETLYWHPTRIGLTQYSGNPSLVISLLITALDVIMILRASPRHSVNPR